MDFTPVSTIHNITINLINCAAALYASGSQIKGHSANAFGNQVFFVNLVSFNLAGEFPSTGFWASDLTISSGITVNTYDCYNQLTAMVKGTASNNIVTEVSFYNSRGFTGNLSSGLTTINLSGGNNTQNMSLKLLGGTGAIDFFFINTPSTGSQINIEYDSGWQYEIDTLDPSGDQPAFSAFTTASFIGSQFQPVHFVPTSYVEDGQTIPNDVVNAYLNGIDIALGNTVPAPLIIQSDFTIPNSPILKATQTWIVASSPSVGITITLPAAPLTGETHQFICANGGQDVTVAGGGFLISGFFLYNNGGVCNVHARIGVFSVDLNAPTDTEQVLTLMNDGAQWVALYNFGFG